MGNCNTCSCNDKGEITTFEVQVDANSKINKNKNRQSAVDQTKQNGYQNGPKKFSDDIFKKNLNQIIRLQSLWRGYSGRKFASFLKQAKRADSKYFTMDESKETVSNVKYNPQAKREERPQYTFKTGATYKGEWIGGFRDGYGIQVWPDGARYEGQWKDNRAHGKGKFIHIDGDVYEGTWINDKANGQGVYLHVNGARYDGQWKDDLQDGMGKETWNDGSNYDGQYKQGKKQGWGTYQWNDGSQYEGMWEENKIKGQGTYKWLDGRCFQGDWVDNNMDGMGVYTWADGRRYEGEYKDDKKHGYGMYIWADQRQYSGWWYKGKQHGLGIYNIGQGQEAKFGLWEDGKRIEWFDQAIASDIQDGKIDFRDQLKKHESWEAFEEYGSDGNKLGFSFYTPKNFNERLQKIKKSFQYN